MYYLTVGAGILPYAYDSKTRDSYFLLGQETKGNTWGDFGGKPSLGEFPSDTASRETEEEILGLLGTKESLKQILLDPKQTHYLNIHQMATWTIDQKNHYSYLITRIYHLFLMKLQTDDFDQCDYADGCKCLPHQFVEKRKIYSEQSLKDNKRLVHFLEKKRIRWFKASDLFSAVYNYHHQASKNCVITLANQQFYIRKCFVESIMQIPAYQEFVDERLSTSRA